MKVSEREELFRRFQVNNIQPTTELIYHSDFELLIAVMLSAQATDISVNKATIKLFAKANTPKKILSLGEDGLKSYIKTIGLFNSKAKHIIQTCEILIKEHHSIVPRDRKSLELLPGVGRKTTNVILNTAFGEPTIAVDTHIFRLSNRLKLAPGKTVLEVEKKLLKAVPDTYKKDAHHWLILHGRYICTARNPKCETCFVKDLCPTGKKHPPDK
jgi:endonuclease-3